MTIPIYDVSILPAIIYPMENIHEEPEIYLGNRAVTGYLSSDITIKARNDAHMALLYDFLITDCNYGLEPFLVPLPMFGVASGDNIKPTLLVRVSGPISMKTPGQTWTGQIKLERIGIIDYIVDNLGDFIVSDLGEYMITDGGDYIPTGKVINSYREVYYG